MRRFSNWVLLVTLTPAVVIRSATYVASATLGTPAATWTDGLAAQGGAATRSLVSSLEGALAEGQSGKAREILGRILERPNLEADTLLEVGVSLAQQEFYSEARQVFTRCANDYPNVFEAHYNLALAEFALQNFPDALTALQKAPQGSAEQQLAGRYLRGKIEEALRQPREAERDLEAAFTAAPQQESYALDLGLFYLHQQAYSKAADVFKRGQELTPRSAFLGLGLALAEFLGGQYDRCIRTSKDLLAAQPDFSPARLLLAFVLNIDGKLTEAETVAAEGLAGSSPHPYLYYLHASILLKLQSADYDRILRELAVAAGAISACSLCSLAQSKVHQAQGDFQTAISDLERAVKADPEFAEAWYRLAPLYERAGRPADAERTRARFGALKAGTENRETEMIRQVFLKALAGASEKQ